jgi:uncharacterized membrane-anchored protein YhcB (DUF1043 family)
MILGPLEIVVIILVGYFLVRFLVRKQKASSEPVCTAKTRFEEIKQAINIQEVD